VIPDDLLVPLDRALRTLFAPASSARPVPGEDLPEAELSAAQRGEAAALMRINHVGEVCAQALYDGQMLVAREARVKDLLGRASREETDHLAWTQHRLEELGGRRSVLEPLFYAGSFAIGVAAGLAGDRWNLGFLAETERQVERHLDRHLERVSPEDVRSRAILTQMQADEVGHAVNAWRQGASDLPAPVRLAMQLASRVMTSTSRWL
jgi:ubiquinone biosynthesis monooxygenase Coq7